MQQYPIPTAADQFEYLLRVYFGGESDHLSCCIDRAYRDMNRTLHGFAQVIEGGSLRVQGSAVVRSFLTSLAVTQSAGFRQTSFDKRHRAATEKLCSTYSAAGFAKFRVGQAQKWLNMALKYVFVFGEDRLPGYAQVFELAHIPLDNIILDQLRPHGVPQLATRWSRIALYEEYMVIQNWVRSVFPGEAPLAVEFALWQNASSSIPQDESAANKRIQQNNPIRIRSKSMVITLDPKLEAALNEMAQRKRVAPEALALEALRDRFLAVTSGDEPEDEWRRRLRRVATDCGVSLSDAAVSSEGIYE